MDLQNSRKNLDELVKSQGMAKLKVRYTRSSGVAKAEAYMWYAEHFATRYDAVDRTFCDAINFDELAKSLGRQREHYRQVG
jgi:hypothetical protein